MSSPRPLEDGVVVSAAAPEPVLRARGLRRDYVGGDGSRLRVLDGVDLDIAPGETVSVIGQSGSGKSTLLQILGGLDRPSGGQMLVAGRDLAALPDEELARVRGRTMGFVFQFHHLLREFTALENVMMPQIIAGTGRREAAERAAGLLEAVGLSPRAHHKPAQLSGGEQQRVAVARAFVHEPRILFADEPTGNLDAATGGRIIELLEELNRERGTTLVLVTHDLELAGRARRVIRLADGAVVSDGALTA
jgi:predicted ABC-type transport system involved in lysophospholipase L1 biosynthesis ATPase subunit